MWIHLPTKMDYILITIVSYYSLLQYYSPVISLYWIIDMQCFIRFLLYIFWWQAVRSGWIMHSKLWHTTLHVTISYILDHAQKFTTYTFIHICWFNFDALAQGNAYKPTKEPINYHGPGGIELTTSRLRQLRQLPVVQHVRFTPLKSRQKTQLQWRARGCTGQLTTCLECTWCQFQHVCVNFELRPDAGDISIHTAVMPGKYVWDR